ncbi:histidine kinase [Paenibacillus oryzisoli]|uniref:cache domain-containing sensor histidine kinase n=1 Tax=Paenibacillus oryzisoli TaxID=1850517 RepID=UPI003D28004A
MLRLDKLFKRFHKSRSLKTKMLMLLVAMSIIPILVVSYCSQYLMFRSATNQSLLLSQQIVNLLANELDQRISNIDQSLNPLNIDLDFQKYLNVPNEDTVSQLRYLRNFRGFFEKMTQSNANISGILYLDKRGKVFYETTHNEIVNMQYQFDQDPTYRRLLTMTDTALLPPHPSKYIENGGVETISLVKPVFNFDTHAFDAWIIVQLDPQQLFSNIEQSDFGQYGEVVMYHAATGERIELTKGSDSHPISASVLASAASGGMKTYVADQENRSYQVASRLMSIDGWTMVGIAPLDVMVKGTEQTKQFTLIIALSLLMISFAAAIYFVQLILKPLERLKSSIVRLGIQKWTTKVPPASVGEIDFLIGSYNAMLDNLEHMEETVQKTEMREKEKELLQLQAHINPHFLFNTLETIGAFAFQHEGEKAEEMVQLMARMMRYNIRSDSGWSSLEEELGNIRDLLKIHYYRTQMNMEAEMDIDDAALSEQIMKLSIQPFVENALKYAGNSFTKGALFRIAIKIRFDADRLVIEIRDNGKGMPPEVRNKYEKLIRSKGQYKDEFFNSHTGIHNVFRRFLLAYGEHFGMEIRSNEHEGTQIILTAERRKNA